MAISEADIDRRLTENKSDLDAINLLLDEVRTTVDGHTTQLAAIWSTLTGHGTRLDSVDTRLGSLDGNVAEILHRLPA